jgi:hypothetical protein
LTDCLCSLALCVSSPVINPTAAYFDTILLVLSDSKLGVTHGPRTAHTRLVYWGEGGFVSKKEESRLDDKHMPGGEKESRHRSGINARALYPLAVTRSASRPLPATVD